MDEEKRIDIEDLINRIDIVAYVSQFVDFIEEKDNELFALCPFHKDEDPSFSITKGTNLFHCFGCKVGGNVLNFIQKKYDVSFRRAIEIACEYLGGDVKELPLSLEATKYIKEFKPPIVNRKEAKYKKLPNDIMTKYDGNLDKIQLWIDEGISVDVLKKYQVKYDPFSNRIVFPIWNEYGDIINVKGRTLDENYKEKKIRKYQNFYDIGRMDYFYNLNFALEHIKKLKRVIIFEAEKSVMLAETYNIHNTIAMMTSSLNQYQLQILIKLGADITFALDKDKDIVDDEEINKLKRYVKVKYIKDKDGLIGEKSSPIDHGYETFYKLYQNRKILR